MASYLKSAMKHTYNMPYIYIKLSSMLIVVPNCVDFDRLGSNMGVEFVDLRLSKKDLLIWASSPSSLH